ncbi:MAG: DUF4892 domain-containing protein [Halieaceae bacterium]|nr:DUF4892 domain-containing protein [Halieaceae bacterium]
MQKFIGICVMAFAPLVVADQSEFTDLLSSPHARLVSEFDEYVTDREIGLDALQKRLGHWGFENSIRVNANLREAIYQIVDGYSAAELLQHHVQIFQDSGALVTLFECEGRDCGRSVQWANRVFGQRLLYGQDNDQRYWVGKASAQEPSLYVAYSAYRTENRQYLVVQRYLLDSALE